MPPSNLPTLAQRSIRQFMRSSPKWTSSQKLTFPLLLNSSPIHAKIISTPNSTRSFSNSSFLSKGITPDSEDPQPQEAEDHVKSLVPTQISDGVYHEIADLYMDKLVAELEALQEEREDVDVELTAGVLTLVFPPNGSYVINKQPPNKQIWLSSPISGPKRYDWVVLGEGQDQKEGGGKGEWIYLRDGSTLSEVMRKEIGIDLANEELP